MNKAEIKTICEKQVKDITMVEYQNLKLNMLNQLGRTSEICNGASKAIELTNPQEAIKRIQEWHKENTLKVDWSKVPVDTKIIVWNSDWRGDEAKRHFARYENGKIFAWDSGETSWTIKNDKQVSKWDNAELAEVFDD